MAQLSAPTRQEDLTGLDLGDQRNLREITGEDRYSIWAFGRLRKLFFITGHPRSGTTWAAAVLARHPRVFCDGEFHLQTIRQGFDAMQRQPWHRVGRDPVHTTAEACFQDTVRLAMGACANKAGDAEWVGDRTPRPLRVLLPGAPHLVILRDGRDVAVSRAIMGMNHAGPAVAAARDNPAFQKTLARFREDPDYFKTHPDQLLASEPFVRNIARHWASFVMRDFDSLDRIQAGEIDATAHLMRYEQLHADPQTARAEMYRFLGLDPDEAEPLTADSRTMPGLGGQDDHRSDKRKGAVGDWRTYFTDNAKTWFKDEAQAALSRAGYEETDQW